jgi:cytoskeleton protein RodZ
MNDSEFQDNPAEAAATPAVSDWPSPGQKLKKHREELGLSHNRVADALHMTAHYVKALETDQYDKLPGKTFVKGYFRAYAKLLDVDVEEVMTCYERYVSALEESEETEAKVIRAKKAYDQNMRWMICAALIIVMVIGVSWWYSSHKSSSATMAASPPANVARAETAASPVAPRVTAQSQAEQANAAMTLIATLDQADLVERAATAPEGDGEDSLDAAGVVAASAAQAAGTDLAVAMTENDLEAPVSAPDAIEASPVTVAADAMAEDVTTPGLTPAGLPDDTIVELADSRQVNLESEGNDLLQVHFSGASWIEVDNGENTRLYNDMLSNGDDLTIRGMAPFNVLVGDVNMVDMTFNSRAVDLTSRMRTDHSARIILEPETN